METILLYFFKYLFEIKKILINNIEIPAERHFKFLQFNLELKCNS